MVMRYFVRDRKREAIISIEERGAALYAVSCDDHAYLVDCERIEDSIYSLLIDGKSYDIVVDGRYGDYEVYLAGRRFSIDVHDGRIPESLVAPGDINVGPQEVKAPMSGRIVRVLVKAGEQVSAGQGVVIVEAMKMENEMKSPIAGQIREVAVTPGQSVDRGAILVCIEPDTVKGSTS